MKKNLLLCLDAFGTIFTPRQPVAKQYGEVARTFGLQVKDEDVAVSFKKAFKALSAQHPNYGKATSLGATAWWTNLITATFTPLLPAATPLPPLLAPTLLSRFSSRDAYALAPDIASYLHSLRSSPARNPLTAGPRLIVGVITNSDPRVPEILRSLGLRVSALRYGSEVPSEGFPAQIPDFDFVVTSYDVGVEKPGRGIFEAAEEVLGGVLRAEGRREGLEGWSRVYVGDERGKDGEGAVGAGWDAGVVVERGDGGTQGVSYRVRNERGEVDVVSDFGALGNLRDRFPLIMG